jgi:hypothetical protein
MTSITQHIQELTQLARPLASHIGRPIKPLALIFCLALASSGRADAQDRDVLIQMAQHHGTSSWYRATEAYQAAFKLAPPSAQEVREFAQVVDGAVPDHSGTTYWVLWSAEGAERWISSCADACRYLTVGMGKTSGSVRGELVSQLAHLLIDLDTMHSITSILIKECEVNIRRLDASIDRNFMDLDHERARKRPSEGTMDRLKSYIDNDRRSRARSAEEMKTLRSVQEESDRLKHQYTGGL